MIAGMTDQITPRQFHGSAGVDDWRVLGEGACAHFPTASFAAGAALVAAIGEQTGPDDHRPDVDLRQGGVTVRLITVADGPRARRQPKRSRRQVAKPTMARFSTAMPSPLPAPYQM